MSEQGKGAKALVYIDKTGGTTEVHTTGEVEVLEIDWEEFEQSETEPTIPAHFVEAFPWLGANLDDALKVWHRRRREREDAGRAAVLKRIEEVAANVSTAELLTVAEMLEGGK